MPQIGGKLTLDNIRFLEATTNRLGPPSLHHDILLKALRKKPYNQRLKTLGLSLNDLKEYIRLVQTQDLENFKQKLTGVSGVQQAQAPQALPQPQAPQAPPQPQAQQVLPLPIQQPTIVPNITPKPSSSSGFFSKVKKLFNKTSTKKSAPPVPRLSVPPPKTQLEIYDEQNRGIDNGLIAPRVSPALSSRSSKSRRRGSAKLSYRPIKISRGLYDVSSSSPPIPSLASSTFTSPPPSYHSSQFSQSTKTSKTSPTQSVSSFSSFPSSSPSSPPRSNTFINLQKTANRLQTKPAEENNTLSKSERKAINREKLRTGAPALSALTEGIKYVGRKGVQGFKETRKKMGEGRRNFNTWRKKRAEAKRLKALSRAVEPRPTKPGFIRRLYNRTFKKGQVVPLDNASRSNSSSASRVSLPSPRSGIAALASAHGVVEPAAAGPKSFFAKLTAKIRNLRAGPVRVPDGNRGPPLLGRSSRSSASSRAVSARISSRSSASSGLPDATFGPAAVAAAERRKLRAQILPPKVSAEFPNEQAPQAPEPVVFFPEGNELAQAVIPQVSWSSRSKASNSAAKVASQQPGWVANFDHPVAPIQSTPMIKFSSSSNSRANGAQVQPVSYIPPNLGPYLVTPPGSTAPVDIGPPRGKASSAEKRADKEVKDIYNNLVVQNEAARALREALARNVQQPEEWVSEFPPTRPPVSSTGSIPQPVSSTGSIPPPPISSTGSIPSPSASVSSSSKKGRSSSSKNRRPSGRSRSSAPPPPPPSAAPALSTGRFTRRTKPYPPMPPLPPPPKESNDLNWHVERIIPIPNSPQPVRSKNVQRRQSSVTRSAIDVLHDSRVTRATSPTFQPHDPTKGRWMG